MTRRYQGNWNEIVEITNKQLSELQAERQLCKHEFMQLVEKIEQMQNIISNQEMSAEQRDSCIAELEQRKHAFQIMERTLRELEGRQHHQQVLLSRHKKQLNDQIAIYNDYMYKIATSCTKMQFDTADLLLPLNPQEIEVKERIKRLEEIYARAQIQLQEMQQQLEQLENQVQELNHYIKSTLKVKNSELEMALKLSERKISEFEKLKQQQIAALDTQMLEVEGRLQQLEFDLKSARDEKRERRKQALDLEKQNDELMNCAEQEYNAAADEREALQNIFEKELERSNEILVEFSKLVEEREVELKALQEELTNNV
ncbi:paramyosin-like [Eurosta solidaginis]|uniref:paramyosin-like n=1 Tax=Eurosta solidaginis TaxID=178769 RepID=UPI0035305D97